MRKLLLVLLVISCLFLQSCGIKDFFEDYPLEKRNVIYIEDVGFDEELNLEFTEYNNEKYYRSELFHGISNDVYAAEKGLVLISWHFNLPFSMIMTYHAPTFENPPFITDAYDCYLHPSFDYTQETFILKHANLKYMDNPETGVEIVFSRAYVEEPISRESIKDPEYAYKRKAFFWYCKEFPALSANVDIFKMDNVYYIRILGKAYPISSEFLALLEENDLLPEAEVIPQS